MRGLREGLEKMWRVKETMVVVVIGAYSAVTPMVGEQQIPGTTSAISVKKSSILGTAPTVTHLFTKHTYP